MVRMHALVGLALVCAVGGAVSSSAQTRAKIVGIGAAPCTQFTANIDGTPEVQRDYLAWAQGFMSAILLSRPAGIDEGLDLNPPSFGLVRQLEFMRQHCRQNPSEHFLDAVVALYKTLRQVNTRP